MVQIPPVWATDNKALMCFTTSVPYCFMSIFTTVVKLVLGVWLPLLFKNHSKLPLPFFEISKHENIGNKN